MKHKNIIIKFRPKNLEEGIPMSILSKLSQLPMRYQIDGGRYAELLDKSKTDEEFGQALQYERVSKYGYLFMYDFHYTGGWYVYMKDKFFPTYDGEVEWIKQVILHYVKEPELDFEVEEW